jgi:hypothetical protein
MGIEAEQVRLSMGKQSANGPKGGQASALKQPQGAVLQTSSANDSTSFRKSGN